MIPFLIEAEEIIIYDENALIDSYVTEIPDICRDASILQDELNFSRKRFRAYDIERFMICSMLLVIHSMTFEVHEHLKNVRTYCAYMGFTSENTTAYST